MFAPILPRPTIPIFIPSSPFHFLSVSRVAILNVSTPSNSRFANAKKHILRLEISVATPKILPCEVPQICDSSVHHRCGGAQMAAPRTLNEPALYCMHYRFKPVMRAEFLVDTVKVIT